MADFCTVLIFFALNFLAEEVLSSFHRRREEEASNALALAAVFTRNFTLK